MHRITGKEAIRYIRKHWKWFAGGAVILVLLALVPQGTFTQRKAGDAMGSLMSIVPSGIFEPGEDGSKYGYNDECGDDRECRQCKANLTCLDCMNRCFNHNGAFYKQDNPRRLEAVVCNQKCIETAKDKTSPDADLRFTDPAGRKYTNPYK